MTSLTTAIAAVAVLLHALFGCCWHHAHAFQAHGERWQSVASGCCTHSCDTSEDGGSPVEAPDHSRDCTGDRCTFVRASDGARCAVSLDLAGLPAMDHASPALHVWHALTAVEPSAQSPARLHLVHCVLLI